MNLEYFDLLSPSPFYLHGIGGIYSTKLLNISRIGIHKYQLYISLLLLTVESYLETENSSEEFQKQLQYYASLSHEEKKSLAIFDLYISNPDFKSLLQECLSFFIDGEISVNDEMKSYIVTKEDRLIGLINRDNFDMLSDGILQRHGIKKEVEKDLSFKNQKALEMYKNLKRHEKELASKKNSNNINPDLELANIISALTAKHNSLNILNIWELTVYQLLDQFQRQQCNVAYEIQSMSVAAWGSKDGKFDINQWFKNLDK